MKLNLWKPQNFIPHKHPYHYGTSQLVWDSTSINYQLCMLHLQVQLQINELNTLVKSYQSVQTSEASKTRDIYGDEGYWKHLYLQSAVFSLKRTCLPNKDMEQQLRFFSTQNHFIKSANHHTMITKVETPSFSMAFAWKMTRVRKACNFMNFQHHTTTLYYTCNSLTTEHS